MFYLIFKIITTLCFIYCLFSILFTRKIFLGKFSKIIYKLGIFINWNVFCYMDNYWLDYYIIIKTEKKAYAWRLIDLKNFVGIYFKPTYIREFAVMFYRNKDWFPLEIKRLVDVYFIKIDDKMTSFKILEVARPIDKDLKKTFNKVLAKRVFFSWSKNNL